MLNGLFQVLSLEQLNGANDWRSSNFLIPFLLRQKGKQKGEPGFNPTFYFTRLNFGRMISFIPQELSGLSKALFWKKIALPPRALFSSSNWIVSNFLLKDWRAIENAILYSFIEAECQPKILKKIYFVPWRILEENSRRCCTKNQLYELRFGAMSFDFFNSRGINFH